MSLAYSNGKLVPAASAVFAADDHGVLYGLGFFETFSYYAPLGSGITYQLY